jgi:Protein of unknown function (DUF4058)
MSSPFPGMNPYFEQADVWHQVHEQLIVYGSAALTKLLAPNYRVSFDANVYLHELSAEERGLMGRPDVGVLQGVGSPPSGPAKNTASGAPVYGFAVPAVDELRESFIEIRDQTGKQLITAIEILSPSNKYAGSDRELYLAKRRKYFKSATHFIEIDLLRGGPRMPLEGLPQCDYCVIVRRANEHPRVGIWPIKLRDQLPAIPVPLKEGDPDCQFDLQGLLHHVYDEGAYRHFIYDGQPEPALRPDDQAWAKDILAQDNIS